MLAFAVKSYRRALIESWKSRRRAQMHFENEKPLDFHLDCMDLLLLGVKQQELSFSGCNLQEPVKVTYCQLTDVDHSVVQVCRVMLLVGVGVGTPFIETK